MVHPLGYGMSPHVAVPPAEAFRRVALATEVPSSWQNPSTTSRFLAPPAGRSAEGDANVSGGLLIPPCFRGCDDFPQ
jgi:hypothetical protein